MGFIGQAIGNWVSGADKAPKDAARIQANATDRATEEQRRQFDITRTDQMPWLTAGTAALGRLQDPNAFAAAPGYAFRRSEGIRDIGNSWAARGGALSGNALKALTDFNQNLASNEYGNWWNQQAGLAGVGQTSANVLAQVGQQTTSSIGNNLITGANARASGIVGSAAVRRNAFNTAMNNDAQNFGRFFGGGYGGYGG